jgi:hypothetical protein
MSNLKEFIDEQQDVFANIQKAVDEAFWDLYEHLDLEYIAQYIAEEAVTESYGSAEIARRKLLEELSYGNS